MGKPVAIEKAVWYTNNVIGDGTHHKKQHYTDNGKGRIPIEKNIAVVDAQGNAYEATYPKRAKGLVKKGRARWIDEHTLCLVCPPTTELEGNSMPDNNKKTDTLHTSAPSTAAAAETAANDRVKAAAEPQSPEKLTMDYLLSKLEEITTGQAFLTDAIAELGKMKSGGPSDVGTQEQAKAVGVIIQAREETNQRLIALYEKMYDDLTVKQTSLKEMALRAAEKAADDNGKLAGFSDILDTIRHID